MTFSQFVTAIYTLRLSARSFNVLCKLAEENAHLAPYLAGKACTTLAAQSVPASEIRMRAQELYDSQK